MNITTHVKFNIHLFTYFYFVEYTSAKAPFDYCNNNESPALPLPVDQNGNVIYNLHTNVHETEQFQSDPNDPSAPSSSASKSMLGHRSD